jgi:hypothetical protein
MKTAPLTPLGSIKGDTWERIYDYTVGEQTFEVTNGSGNAEILVVGGGGSGGFDDGNSGTCGGGGGRVNHVSALALSKGKYGVIVGRGGVVDVLAKKDGAYSQFRSISITGGEGVATSGGLLGSGGTGGASSKTLDGSVTSYTGGAGGGSGLNSTLYGGGGAGSGANGNGSVEGNLNGGAGYQSSISGTAVNYGGGGGGGREVSAPYTYGNGGLGGGGRGEGGNDDAAVAGTDGLGGGGGGAGGERNVRSGNPKSGGSGVVIIRYLASEMTATGGTITTDGLYKVHTFSTVSTPETSLTISGLNGDVDEEYILESKVVNGYNGNSLIFLRPNNDSNANYGRQSLTGVNTVVGATRDTINEFRISGATTLNMLCESVIRIYSKSGFVRTGILERTLDISGTTVTEIGLHGQSWNNTAGNIISLVIAASQTGGLGVGSQFTLWKKSRRSA